MKRLIFAFFSLWMFTSSSQTLWQINKDTVITYNYLDGDEFSAGDISKEKWSSWYGWGRCIVSNKEQQYYTDFKNHEIKNNCLYLTVKKEKVDARLVDWMSDTDSIKSGKGEFMGLNKRKWEYTSGLLQTKRKFLKGYYEIKFKAPSDKGLWPAFWLYGASKDNYNEEIDMMELKGDRESQIHVDTHCRGCDVVHTPIGQKRSFGGWIKLNGKLNKGFNVVSCLWSDEDVRYYVNGKCIAISKVAFSGAKPLAVNVAVADDNGPFHPGPDKKDTLFEPFIVDYIRVWSQEENPNTSILELEDANPLPENVEHKRSPKMLYGKKSEHANEGIFVSVFRNEDGTLKLFCNGLPKSEKYRVKLSKEDQVLFEKTTDLRELNIPLIAEHGVKVEVNYGNKTASKTFRLAR